MDLLLLSRIQFAVNIGFHYLYPPLSIGLGFLLIIMEGMYVKTKNPLYKQMTKFWVKVFALTFAIGVATGLVQVFAFGTNWSRYSRFVGDVFGSALAAEGIFAFFLEAGFLGLMLFGWEKVKPSIHYLATIMVAAGAHFSAIWIVVANSWMQTPAGYKIVGEGDQARAVVTDFWEMIFNPSAVDRVIHVVIGCWLSGIFLVVSVAAYYILKKRHVAFAKTTMKIGLITGAVTLLLQFISADSSAKGVAENQPAKLAAMEGIFTSGPAPMGIIGWVDTEERRVKGIQIPGLLSFLIHGDFQQPVVGLDQIPQEDWPKVNVVFQAYHLMVYMWGAMVAVTALGLYYLRKKKLQNQRWLLWGLIVSVGFPQIANQVGWMTAEIGRQPWIVQGLLRTSQGVTTSLSSAQVFGSLTMFVLIYLLLFALFLFLLDRKIKHGPTDEPEEMIYRNMYEASKTPLKTNET